MALVLAMSPLACLRTTSFSCALDEECGSGGVCEPTDFCSFADGRCSTGRRYGDLSGPFAGTCVGAPSGGDGGVPDALGCNTNPAYMALGGVPARYRLIMNIATWQTHLAECMNDGAFLVVPDDAAELAAVSAFAAGNPFWAGVTDLMHENTFTTVLGNAATFLPWDAPTGQPDNKQNEDCVRVDPSLRTFFDDKCTVDHAAVCECAP